jgi:hypothetical protein
VAEQPIQKPGPAGKQAEVDRQWTLKILSIQILHILIERRLADQPPVTSASPAFAACRDK